MQCVVMLGRATSWSRNPNEYDGSGLDLFGSPHAILQRSRAQSVSRRFWSSLVSHQFRSDRSSDPRLRLSSIQEWDKVSEPSSSKKLVSKDSSQVCTLAIRQVARPFFRHVGGASHFFFAKPLNFPFSQSVRRLIEKRAYTVALFTFGATKEPKSLLQCSSLRVVDALEELPLFASGQLGDEMEMIAEELRARGKITLKGFLEYATHFPHLTPALCALRRHIWDLLSCCGASLILDAPGSMEKLLEGFSRRQNERKLCDSSLHCDRAKFFAILFALELSSKEGTAILGLSHPKHASLFSLYFEEDFVGLDGTLKEEDEAKMPAASKQQKALTLSSSATKKRSFSQLSTCSKRFSTRVHNSALMLSRLEEARHQILPCSPQVRLTKTPFTHFIKPPQAQQSSVDRLLQVELNLLKELSISGQRRHETALELEMWRARSAEEEAI